MNKILLAIIILCGGAAVVFGVLPFVTELRFPGAMQILIAIVMFLTASTHFQQAKKQNRTFWLYIIAAALWVITAVINIIAFFNA